jgi:hypothetical protein
MYLLICELNETEQLNLVACRIASRKTQFITNSRLFWGRRKNLESFTNYCIKTDHDKIQLKEIVVKHLPTIVVAAVMIATTPVHMTLLHDAYFTRRYTSRRLGTTTVAYIPPSFRAVLAPRLGLVNNLLNTHAPGCRTAMMEHAKLIQA